MLGANDTLVKYNNPVLVTEKGVKADAGQIKGPAAPKSPGSASVPNVVVEARCESEELLNTILPPKFWAEDGHLWTQTVSSTPATRQDVINLQELLDAKLEQCQARETGICPVRRELYMQCFGEHLDVHALNMCRLYLIRGTPVCGESR